MRKNMNASILDVAQNSNRRIIEGTIGLTDKKNQ